MKAVKLTDKVYWVGAIDWDLRNFHGYATGRGSTYNAYLIMADKITLVDTVKSCFKGEMMARISSVIEPSKIDYIISNHSEMDHSGALPDVIDVIQPERVFASLMGVKALQKHFSFNIQLDPVADGEKLSLGNMDLQFFETRMIHWPDSMFTYLKSENILFSQDAFGMHLATDKLFADENDPSVVRFEAKKYYANILTPYSQRVAKALERLRELKLDISMMAPDHGPIWRKIDQILEWYDEWAEQKPTKKAVIIYDTMWESTAEMARAVADGVKAAGATPKLMSLSKENRSDIATELLEAGALIVGSPTLNNQMFPTVADILCYLKGLRFKELVGGVFGSYGWSADATRQIREILTEMKITLITDDVNVQYRPDKTDLEKCFQLGRAIGAKLEG